MRRQLLPLTLLLPLLLVAGCDLVQGIFKVGFFAGIIVLLIVVGAIWLLSRLFRRRG